MKRRSFFQAVTAGICAGLTPPALLGLTNAPRIAPDDISSDLRKLRSARWTEDRAFAYMRGFGEIKGCNYVPSDGSGVMNAPKTELIRRELGWASDVVGLNSVRIWVELADFQIDPDRLFANFESFLDVCDKNRIKVLPVLSMQSELDPDVSLADARAETPILNFRPSVHGGGWKYPRRLHWPCCEPDGSIPAKTVSAWERTKPSAEKFFRGFLERYAKDERILLWDLYNEAPKSARSYVETIFQWARQVAPSQPLSVCWQGHDLSDVITFHTYGRPGFETPNRNSPGWDFLNELDWARAWGRPMLCTEWLARPFGNSVSAILPFFERYHIGWFVWGLCAGGPAQCQFPWDWPIGSPPPEKWFHCLLYPDGTPYSADETLDIHNFRYRELAPQMPTQSYWNSRTIDVNHADSRMLPRGENEILSALNP